MFLFAPDQLPRPRADGELGAQLQHSMLVDSIRFLIFSQRLNQVRAEKVEIAFVMSEQLMQEGDSVDMSN